MAQLYTQFGTILFSVAALLLVHGSAVCGSAGEKYPLHATVATT